MVCHVNLWGRDLLCTFFIICVVYAQLTFAVSNNPDTSVLESSTLSGAETDSASVNYSSRINSQPQTSDINGIVALDNMTVTVSRWDRLLEASQLLSIIKSEWIGYNKTVADVIAEQTEVQTRRYGGTESFQTVTIRGVQDNEVLVFFDGIPLNSVMGVVINLKSKSSIKSQSVSSQAVFEAYGYLKYSIETNYCFTDKIRIFGSLNFVKSDNYWPYLDRTKTSYSTDDDEVRTVENHYNNFFEVRIHPSFDISGERTLASGIAYLISETGIPASEGRVISRAASVAIAVSLKQKHY